ncbi:MAG: hypothetical protein K1Y02_05515 [Candidatus Hydrogenedentes bacterium]|nr:hypothetical protein [Candidatus Hydrogenedentota bacterium]
MEVSVIIGIAGTVVVLALTLRAWMRSKEGSTRGGGPTSSFEMECNTCHRHLVIHPHQLVTLSGPEMALCVRVKPELRGRKMAEFVCPYCEASHAFLMDRRPPEWIGANLYSPQVKTSTCMECSKPLRKAPWPPMLYDGRLNEAPELHADLGLVCSRCQAVVCVACVKNATRNRTKDGSLVCPRCHRTPVNRVFHPEL